MTGTIKAMASPCQERPLLTGITAVGEPVELSFTEFDGRVRVAGNIVYRVRGSSNGAIKELIRAFTDACRKQV